VDGLREDAASERARADALAADAERARAEQAAEADAAARSPAQRAEMTGAALGGMDGALRALSAGDASGIDQALAAQADALAAARTEAGQRGADREAQQAGAGAEWIAQAREALSRSDLYQARLALARAAAAAADAHALAREGASARGGQPAPLPGTAPGY
jgi:colicin import membrane protein